MEDEGVRREGSAVFGGVAKRERERQQEAEKGIRAVVADAVGEERQKGKVIWIVSGAKE